MSWLDDIHNATKELESPQKFWHWSALAAVSAVVKRNVYLRKRTKTSTAYILYPNVYIFLVAKSGMRKGPPIKMARKLVKEVDNTRIIAGRASIQGIIKEISTQYVTEDGVMRDDSGFFLCASEFRSSLIGDPDALVTLTDLYDGDFADDWKYLLKGSEGSNTLKDIYAVILGGSNPTHLKEKIQRADIEGGFIGRSFIVFADKKANINPLTDDVENDELTEDEVDMLDYPHLAGRLKEISLLKGKFKYSLEAKNIYDKWYTALNKTEFTDKTGTLDRLHDAVLKVAMLISLTKKDDLVFLPDDIDEAIEACNELAGNVNRAIMPSGKQAYAEQTALILQELLNAPGYTLNKRQVLQRLWGDLDAFDLDRIKETLMQKDAIDVRREGKAEHFTLKPWVVQQYLQEKMSSDD